MSDNEQVFEQPEVAEPVTEPETVTEPEPEQVKTKTKKPRKPLSDERKAQLREQLKKGRETSLKNRQSKAKKKGTFRQAVSVEQQEAEEHALLEAESKIAAAAARKDQRDTAKHARAEAAEAKKMAVQLRTELDELKAERHASKSRKAKLKAAAETAAETAKAAEAAKAPVVAPAPEKKVLTGRELSRMMKGL